MKVDDSCSQFDAPGNDNSASKTEEWVCLTNTGSTSVQMEAWQLMDNTGKGGNDGYRYTFPSFILAPGATVRVHTGSGLNTQADLFWGKSVWVWNNDGDTAYLFDSLGNLVAQYAY